MIKDELREKEPIAYRSLHNALKEGRVAHSYLFSGEYHPLKKEAAILLAQSIIEGKRDFACEECRTCQRIRNGEYLDVIMIDGYDASIKTDMIDDLLVRFSQTALEESGKKVYIIANVNNASVKSLNSLLKFMEEPSSENIYGIFITDRKDDLLSTVVSRCQEIPFRQREYSHLISRYMEKGFDDVDAYLLSNILHEFKEDMEVNDPAYVNAREYVYKMIDHLDEREYIPVLFSQEFYRSSKNEEFKKSCDYFLDIMVKMLEDALSLKGCDDGDYQQKCAALRDHDAAKLLEIFEEAKDKCLYNAERRLLFDGIAFSLLS